jgi:hypothetical protein
MFDFGTLLAMVGANPHLAPQLDALGVPAPDPSMMKLGATGGIDSSLGADMPNPDDMLPSSSQLGSMNSGNMLPNAQDSAKPKDNSGMDLAGLAALKGIAPPPIQPIMNGGVTGGQQAKLPDKHPLTATADIHNLMGMLLQVLSAGHQIPTLGNLMRS